MHTQLENIKFGTDGLVPVITQDVDTLEVLMFAYMNREALEITLKGPYATYFSRSRQALWTKGETSGNLQEVVSVRYDCDADTVLLRVRQRGVACHTGARTCFFNVLKDLETLPDASVLGELFHVIEDRKANPKEGSYTNKLFTGGLDRILKKVGEEAGEVIIAAKNEDQEEIAYEAADLIYHLFVLLSQQSMTPGHVYEQLRKRQMIVK
ncbi:MAG: bifunctional phosphoribosyl-AMP cyclohydrolase/phosphoribosyl-ATP diphosphatase HisIE [Bacillota bacterium]